MHPSKTSGLLLIALVVFAFGLAAKLDPIFESWPGSRTQSTDLITTVLGDSRRMFANQFYVKADEYYHSGYYPTIFDNRAAFATAHMAEDTGAVSSKNHGDEEGFLGAPRDWIDAVGRHFFPDRHTHLDEGGAAGDLSGTENVREILPWLKLSAKLDPDNVTTYTVTAYWLRIRMQRVAEAEQVLREGLRNSPRSFEILFELGRLYSESEHDDGRARNVWELAARYWNKLPPQDKTDNKLIFEQITTHLANLEANDGNYDRAIEWFNAAKTVSNTPQDIQRNIDDLKKKITGQIPLAPPKLY